MLFIPSSFVAQLALSKDLLSKGCLVKLIVCCWVSCLVLHYINSFCVVTSYLFEMTLAFS